MNTRADFYLGMGKSAQWLGSIGTDGMPSAVLRELSMDYGQTISGEDDWRESVTAILLAHEEATHPDWGWPWPWANSCGTDYAYAFEPEQQQVLVSCFGTGWMDIWEYTKQSDEQERAQQGGIESFPDMEEIMAIRWDSGNAPMVLGPDGSLVNPKQEFADMNKPKEKK